MLALCWDNYPVPIDGSIRIRIRFNENQAGGRFVFHCHIVEHEDKGMMAAIEVLPEAILESWSNLAVPE